MTLTEEQVECLSVAAKPLVEWMLANCHPHVTVAVSYGRVELLEGVATCEPITDAWAKKPKGGAA